ncbi:hypothetical protein [Leptospira interrogans]|uniref:hypothetical protein n=1 Tax=Leptospira interrogans TaxID=173 RepID=UPI0002BADBB3|nr:hypothetical protein [Leptospira interrogans]EMO96240.1 hypothetical protein LEP1GSC109_1991 [Leptospira interrogans str. UI 13372]QOI33687.1 hypothetical protein LeptoLang_05260 [Leptospira interrogans serovar Icterohaemorrhagiae]
MKNKYLKIRNVTKSVGTTTNQNFHGKIYKLNFSRQRILIRKNKCGTTKKLNEIRMTRKFANC